MSTIQELESFIEVITETRTINEDQIDLVIKITKELIECKKNNIKS